MNPVIQRVLLGLMGFSSALGASLTTLDGGSTMTLAQFGDIPLVAWLLSFGAGISGALGSKGAAK